MSNQELAAEIREDVQEVEKRMTRIIKNIGGIIASGEVTGLPLAILQGVKTTCKGVYRTVVGAHATLEALANMVGVRFGGK